LRRFRSCARLAIFLLITNPKRTGEVCPPGTSGRKRT
jgi:hypothetical protein